MIIKQEEIIDDEGEAISLSVELSSETTGEKLASVEFHNLNENPEDAYLSRELGDAYGIVDLLRYAYEAGKAGEDFLLSKHQEEYE